MMVYSTYKRKPTSAGRKHRKPLFTRRAGLWFLIITTSLVILLRVATWLNAQDLFEFKTRNIKVTGAKYLQAAEILDYAAVDPTIGLFNLDLKAIAARVKNHPLIEDAIVSRRLPAGLEIRVVEKRPIAILNDGNLQAIDENAECLPEFRQEMLFDFPVITQVPRQATERLRRIVSFLKYVQRQHFQLYADISEISYSDAAGIYFYLTNDVVPVVMGNGNFAAKSQQLVQVLTLLKSKQRLSKVEYMDLRFDNQVIVKEENNI